MLFGAREQLASHWRDLAEGRLLLDSLKRNGRGKTFFPRLRHREASLAAAIIRCAAAQSGAASIASSFQIAIKAAVVAGSEQEKKRSDMADRLIQEVRRGIPRRDCHPEPPNQGRPDRPRG